MGPKPTAAAAVEQLCALGKDSRLGVPTSAGTSSSAGRTRRTTRLTTTPAACAATTPAMPAAHSLAPAAGGPAGGAERQPAQRVLAEVRQTPGDGHGGGAPERTTGGAEQASVQPEQGGALGRIHRGDCRAGDGGTRGRAAERSVTVSLLSQTHHAPHDPVPTGRTHRAAERIQAL